MTFTQDATLTPLREAFERLSVDDQLGLFWFIYTEMGQSITPAAPGASTASPEIAEGLFNQVKALSPEAQLQVQRDLVARRDTQISREYGALSDTTKLLFWYRLAQAMETATIIPMPANYQLPAAAADLFTQIQRLEFQQQITLFRDIVSPMGAPPQAGAGI